MPFFNSLSGDSDFLSFYVICLVPTCFRKGDILYTAQSWRIVFRIPEFVLSFYVFDNSIFTDTSAAIEYDIDHCDR